jgi:hypothetical protein
VRSIADRLERRGAWRARRRVAVSLAVAAGALALPAPGSAAPPSLELGFADALFASKDASVRELWLDRATSTGASIARVNVRWSAIAPVDPPAGFDGSDPAASGYLWTKLDATVRSAVAHGMRVMLTVYSAPRWAEAPGRPHGAEAGTWKPRASALGDFAQALAERYGGGFLDPLDPVTPLPRVSLFEVWNEPNLDTYLGPQWRGRRSVGPSIYRSLLNSFYASVKQVQPTARVIAGSLAPFGDPPGGARTRPVEFLRGLLCLRGARMRRSRCPEPAHLDVLSDHPIAVGPPLQGAGNPLEVTTPDLGRLKRVVTSAVRRHTVLPRRPKPLWVTEFWYDSSPPDPDGVPIARQARWYEQDLYLFWRQGARVAIVLQLRDDPREVGYPYSSQAGAYLLDGRAKPSQTAFNFPLVARRVDHGHVVVWGIAPGPGRVRIEARRRRGWRTLASIATRGRPHPFTRRLALAGPARLLAQLNGARSLTWTQR